MLCILKLNGIDYYINSDRTHTISVFGKKENIIKKLDENFCITPYIVINNENNFVNVEGFIVKMEYIKTTRGKKKISFRMSRRNSKHRIRGFREYISEFKATLQTIC